MRRLRGGTRVLHVVGVLGRASSGTEAVVRPVWSAEGGWTAERAALGELLTERGVALPW